MDRTVSAVKKREKILIKAVADIQKSGKTDSASEWLCDNAALLLSELNGFVTYCKKHTDFCPERLFDFCMSLARKGIPGTQSDICAAMLPFAPSVSECAALLPTLGAAYAVCAADSRKSAETVSFCVKAVRSLADADAEEIFAAVSDTEKELLKDPAGIYPVMSAETKAAYRAAVVKTAKREGITEKEAASEALVRAKNAVNGENSHIGFYLPLNEKRKAAKWYLTAELLACVIICAAAAVITDRVSVFFLCLLPVYAFVRCLSGLITPVLFPARPVLSLDGEAGGVYLPSVLITVASLLPDARSAADEYAHFAALRSSDSSPGTAVMALFDLKNADEPFVSSDKADIKAMKDVIDRLNSDFGGGFIMAVRDRVYSPTENEYTGQERKRGAITALVKLLTDGENGFSVLYGDLNAVKDKKYILALDSDSELSFEVTHRLLCAACHPLNAPVYDPALRRITQGYGCIVPRTETSLASSCKTLFSTLFTSGGASAYSPAVSERYMDMFSTSLFTGKGIIDVRAYADVCANAFDEGRILSHDIPEGALLRTAFLGGAVLTDSFPSSPLSYFRRAQRWIRGDIQNAPLIFRGTSRSKSSAELPALAKFQLADNIRVALTPVLCLVCLFAGAFSEGAATAVFILTAVLGISGDGLVLCVGSVISGGISSLTRTFFSSSVSQSLRALLRAALMLGALPLNAAVSADAVIRAVYRTAVSKKHTLQWTTASAAEGQSGKKLVFSLFFPLLCAFSLIFLSKFSAVPGAVILLCTPFLLSDGIKLKNRRPEIKQDTREILISYMSSMWDFFAENVTAEENHLPPDNIQETPVRRTAHRTSPTNIGLYLVSALAAADMAFISADELFERVFAAFETLFSLMRFKGLLYNWYDTKTLQPLKPLFVSTVDCGNFEVCLTALREGLKEYARNDARFNALVIKADALLSEGDMSLLYNKKRGLFSIGMDVSANRLSDSFYDLFMSEAVMTSYYHIAKRDVPASHWGRLGRPLVKSGRYTAAVSWTGTMFEYFMPSLFLPLYENSFRYEALKVCLYEQKRFSLPKQPYGVSESGYCSFDPSLSYRYRANGIRRLALKRGADCERIYSPYSTFLTLSEDPADAVKNLSRFASLHALGRYGFYEAVDFSSPGNVRQDYMLVRSYMAHHIGMSIIACANAVNGDIFVKRFMRDKNMLSADSLLHEKLPFDAKASSRLFTDGGKKETPVRLGNEAAAESDCGAAVFSNGEDSFICDIYGRHRFLHSSLSVLGWSKRSQGIFAGVSVNGGALRPLPQGAGELKDTCFYCSTEIDGVSIQCAPALLNNFSALAFPVKLKNTGEKTATAELYYYFEPDFTPPYAPSEHPAFDGLMIRAGYEKRLKALVFEQKNTRAQRIALAVGFYDGADFMFECDREKALGRNIYRRYPFDGNIPEFADNTACLYPCGAAKLSITLAPGKKCEKVLLAAADETGQRAVSVLARIRQTKLPDVRKAAPGLLKNSPFTAAMPDEFAAGVYFGAATAEKTEARSKNRLPVSALWQAGISGDLPVIAVKTDALPENAAEAFIRLHSALSVTGTANDLVFLTSFNGDYRSGLPEELNRRIKKSGCEAHTGERGGIHIVRTGEYGEDFVLLLKSLPGVFFPCGGDEKIKVPPPDSFVPEKSLPASDAGSCFVPGGYHIGEKPPRPWCHTLSNRSFGTLLSDSSLGYTWALNSRQNKLTPWDNDINSDNCGEKVFIKTGTALYDAVCGADVAFYDDKAVYTSVCGSLTARITVQTDARAMKKRVSVKLTGINTAGVQVIYSVTPLLSESGKYKPFVKRLENADAAVFTNPANTDYGGFAAFYAAVPFEVSVHGERTGLCVTAGAENEFAVDFFCVFSRSLKGVGGLAALPFREPLPERVRFTEFSEPLNAFGSALLLHNVVDSRFFARTGFYQCSGAYGFRDQLQDAAALIPTHPQLVKRHIIRCCAAQFREGDVLHWFHTVPFPSPCLKGVRTRCSDDLLWLPLTVSEYIKAENDTALLKIPVAFLAGESLRPDEQERCGAFRASGETAGVYEHCIRAIKHSFSFGEHSLPLIKAGDWNDSFSEVGVKFKGESVWLAEFLRLVCLRFAPVCAFMKDEENRRLLLETAEKMKTAVLKHGWNGKYFIRGYYDSGEKLGDDGNAECCIDLLTQAFAVLSDTADAKKYSSALSCAFKQLYDEEKGLLKLFTPPFSASSPRAGYVNDYPEGVRENGGQYTHAAVWFALALKKAGYNRESLRLLEVLCPAAKYRDSRTGEAFANEPYAMTGDICSSEELAGRGGWSLYTGSAGWYLRAMRNLI